MVAQLKILIWLISPGLAEGASAGTTAVGLEACCA